MNTQCKTWGCLSCRDRMKALFRARVTLGCLTMAPCAFMTVTYKAESPRLQDAQCVAKDWRALWRLLKKHHPGSREMEWMRVMELTKKGTPHHHVVIGRTVGQIRCWTRDGFRIDRYRSRLGKCMCLAHVWGALWQEVTGDSYIVHATPVGGAEEAGGYMSKYMEKEFDRGRARELGMGRRWSSSRGWPGNGRRRLLQTESAGWARTSWAAHHVDEDLLGGPEDLLERTGNDLTKHRDEILSKRRFERKALQYVENGSTPDVRN